MMKAHGIADARGYARFETVQAYYSIAGRDLEREVVPMMQDQGMGLMVWSPMAGGLLSGKFTRDGAGGRTARAGSASTSRRSIKRSGLGLRRCDEGHR
jgi:aryl-alcohol dehydrogenase-like predicted oxidoreductase